MGSGNSGKGSKPGLVAVGIETVNILSPYAYDYNIPKTDLLFPISRSTAFRNIQAAYLKAGLRLPSVERDRVGAIHILRHSGCLARLALSGSPREVQIQLRHKSSAMTLRYQKTFTRLKDYAISRRLMSFRRYKYGNSRDKHKTTKFRHFPILEIGEQNRDNSKVSPDTFRARHLAEVLRILKRPALFE